jgi:hypothetical protein
MNERQIRERLSRTREQLAAAHNRALLAELREEWELKAKGWPKFDWVWEQPARPVGGYHVGPGDPDWSWRRGSGWR